MNSRKLTGVLLPVFVVALTILGQTSSAPEITFIVFPPQILADGNPVNGLVGFKDADGDVVRADFTVVAATDFQSFTVTPDVKGQKDGAFSFQIATRIPQRVILRVTLIDEAGNRSAPKNFSFVVNALPQPPEITFVNFPPEIRSDGNPVSGIVGFADPNGDVVRADFTVVSAIDFQPFTVTPDVKGQTGGSFEFKLATRTAQRVTLRVTLTDEAGNKSAPKEFSFEAIAVSRPPEIIALNFPEKITSDGRSVEGIVSFKDPDGDLIRADFEVIEAQNFAPFSVDPQARGKTEGSFSFRLATTIPQRVRLKVTLLDAAGNKSTPREFGFVAEAIPATLQVTPSRLAFSGKARQANPSAQTIEIRNSGAGTMSWSISVDGPWLSVAPLRGDIVAGQSQRVEVRVELRDLSAGSYTGTIIVTALGAQGSPQRVNVSLSVEPARLSISPRVIGQVFTGGQRPNGIAATRNFVYVANTDTHNVTVIDVRTQKALPNLIRVGQFPNLIAALPDDSRVYVANGGSDDLSVINTRSNQVVAAIKVGRGPFGIGVSADGQRAYVTNFYSDDISVIDTTTNQVVRTISGIKAPSDIKVTPDGRFGYVASVDIEVIDLQTGTKVRTIDVELEPWRIAMSPDGKFVYVSLAGNSGSPGKVAVIETASNRIVRTVETGGVDSFGVALMPDGGHLFVANITSNSVSVIDTESLKVIATIKEALWLARPLEVAVTPDGKWAFVTNMTNSVSIIDLGVR
jgi:YVTN family beta-propeller protein